MMWQQFATQLLVSLGANAALLIVLIKFWLDRDLKRYEKQLDRLNGAFQTRFGKYHLDSVDATCQAYALFVDLHNSVFRYCFPDWDTDDTLKEKSKRIAADMMVRFYEHFRKTQILMEDATIAEFEKNFRFLQEVYGKKDTKEFADENRFQVASTIYADMTKTVPGMLETLRCEIRKKIGPEQNRC